MTIAKNMVTNFDTIKVLGANTAAFTVLSSFEDIDSFFKFTLVVVSVLYSIFKCVVLIRKEIRDSKKEFTEKE